MYTERLYYIDPYLREFTAQVIATTQRDRQPVVALDRTAFYPTGGGQPNDTGTLNGVPVIDVVTENQLVWHVMAGDLPEGTVTGRIDWARRFDHMQQHSGQHILSQAFIQACSAETVAFHLGADASTIDLNRVDLSPEMLSAAEAAANAVIDAALPVSAAIVSPDELARLPLRKPPKVTEDIRIVQVADYDWSACGGTHVGNSAQIGLIKVTGTERRGAETRVTFLCGIRARADYAALQMLAEGLIARFTTARGELLAMVDRRAAEMQALRRELADLEGQWIESTAAALWSAAELSGTYRLVVQALDHPVERVKRLAQALRSRSGAVVCLAALGERPQLLFTRADDVALNMGDVLRRAAAAAGGRGGGRPDWAQGGAPTTDAVQRALAAVIAELGMRTSG